MSPRRGFTLIELLMTLLIASILLAVGAPSLSSFYDSQKAVSFSNNLLSQILYSRSEAIKRQRNVTLTVTQQETGVLIEVQADGNVNLLRNQFTQDSAYAVAGIPRVVFDARGRATTNGCMSVSIGTGENYSKSVTVYPAGKAEITDGVCP